MFKRYLTLPLSKKHSCFLWGPRQTGKSTLLKQLFPDAVYYDLLLSDEYLRLLKNPGLIREECQASKLTGDNQKNPVIIDEVQKIPELLDEIHWLIENRKLRFILCGSSARKLKRGHGNLLGGRAVSYTLNPLSYCEIPDFSMDKALNNGLLPPFYPEENPHRLIGSYTGNYLQEEIVSEAIIRNISSFNKFLETAAFSNGEMINYNNIARECAVSSPTVKEYFQILCDTLIGGYLPAYQKQKKRRLIHAPKFYFFDMGIVNFLTRRGKIEQNSELYGKTLEHFIYMELKAYSEYSEKLFPVSFWRTASQFEVDFILGDHEAAIEVKSTRMANNNHMKGMRAFKEEYKSIKYIIISNDPKPRTTDDHIDILPWQEFLKRLWNGEIL